MFEVPGANISEVHVTEAYVLGKESLVYVRDSSSANRENTEEDELNTSIRLKQ